MPWSVASTTRYSRIAADAPEDEEAPEDRLVGAQVHVPRGDEEELHDAMTSSSSDDQPVGDRALEVRDARPRAR